MYICTKKYNRLEFFSLFNNAYHFSRSLLQRTIKCLMKRFTFLIFVQSYDHSPPSCSISLTHIHIHTHVCCYSSFRIILHRNKDCQTIRRFLLTLFAIFLFIFSPPLSHFFYNKYVHTLNICTSLKIFSFNFLLLVYSSPPSASNNIYHIANLKRDILSCLFFYPITFFSFSCVTI